MSSISCLVRRGESSLKASTISPSRIRPIFPCGSISANLSCTALIISVFQKLRSSSERKSKLSFCSVLGELSMDWFSGVDVEVDGDENCDEGEK